MSRIDNGLSIGFRGAEEFKYADVVSGDEGMNMMVRITSGRHARVESPMLVFQNQISSYPIRNVPDNVAGVCHRSGLKRWMDQTEFKEWLREHRSISKSNGRERHMFVDNCSGYNANETVLEYQRNINTKLRKLPANATDRCQPTDSFITPMIKDGGKRRWDEYKSGKISRGE